MSPFPRAAYAPITRYTPDRRPIDVDLSDNTSRWGVHPAALAAVRSAEADDLTRYPSVYADTLRAAAARRFGVAEASIATGGGSDDVLDSVFRAAGEPGEDVAYLTPTFSMVETFARMNGMRPAPCVGGAPDPSVLLEGNPAVVYLCRPNNPTGTSSERAWIASLLDAVGDDGPLVVIDEAYADFAEDDFLADAAVSPRLLVVRTLSKAYGLAGLRIGFAIGSPDVILEVEKSRGPYKVSRVAERAGAAVLNDEEGWVPEVVAGVREGRSRLLSELERRGLSPVPSLANFVLVPTGRQSAAELTGELRSRGVAVRPFPDLPGIGDAIRISVGPPPEIDAFLDALDEVLP